MVKQRSPLTQNVSAAPPSSGPHTDQVDCIDGRCAITAFQAASAG
jgi:hypothetical protein